MVPVGVSFDEKALRFPTAPPPRRVIKPEEVKAVAGFDQPLNFEQQEATTLAKSRFFARATPPAPEIPEEPQPPLYVKVDIYQRILGELDTVKGKLTHLQEINSRLESSEYNEDQHFVKLRRAVKNLHDRLQQMDKTLFKG